MKQVYCILLVLLTGSAAVAPDQKQAGLVGILRVTVEESSHIVSAF